MPVYPNPHNPAQPPSSVPARSDTLIYAYEARFARWLQKCFPEIELATYANSYQMFQAMSDITYYPAFYYNRSETDWSFNKIFTVYDQDTQKNLHFCPFLQEYTGRLYFKNWAEAFEASRKLRFFWAPNCYLKAPWNGKDEVDVNLRLLSIKVNEERSPADNKGAARAVEFKWRSQLFAQETPTEKATLTESISIHLFANKTVITPTNSDIEIFVDETGIESNTL